MSTQATPEFVEEELSEQAVHDFLAAHPDFFERHSTLLSSLNLPHASGGAISLVERQVSVLRQKELKLERKLRELIEVARRNSAVELIEQVAHPVDKHRKRELLSHLVGAGYWQQVLVFMRAKHGANRLARQLEADGLSATAIHGNKSQAARTRALADFKQGRVRVLVATDIAARGLDIDQLPHVVNYELPNVPEDYVHRIGRTGRAGNEGQAVSLVCVDEHKLLGDIERLLKRDLPRIMIPGYEPDPSIRAEPIVRRSGPGGQAQARARNQRPRQGPGNDRSRSGTPRASAASGRNKPGSAATPGNGKRAGSGKPSRRPAQARPA